MAGVATEKPGSHPYPEGAFSFFTRKVLLAKNRNETFYTIYLFSETRRGYREAERSEGSFKHTCWLNFAFFDMRGSLLFSVSLVAPKCRTEKLW